ncbi:hypothetical protein [Amycolatopsis sp. NPDC059657]|uniref:hypothetical protein n=1 Tax=Amycolatopsis sp. NPDC059657 TaxID=3346899 RepID=UPI00367359A4
MYEPWSDQDLNDAASNAAEGFDLDDSEARELVDMVVEAIEEGGDAVDDAVWEVQEHDPRVSGEDFVEDVATSLGYDGFDL